MKNDAAKTIANQKVFVKLTSMLELQEQFMSTLKSFENSPSTSIIRDRARGMAQAIRILNLPITIPNGF